MLIVPAESKNEPWNERAIDIRVDDNATPLRELRRLYNVHIAYEHMNAGDLAVEKGNMAKAMEEYNTAMKMFPKNLEMQYWTAITLANSGQVTKAASMLKFIYQKDPNWRELTRRLPKVNLLTIGQTDLPKLLNP